MTEQNRDVQPGDFADRAREANKHLGSRAEALQIDSRVPLLCECGETSCDALVLMKLADYYALRHRGESVIAPGHRTV